MIATDAGEALRGRIVLVTGGLGFIGSTLSRRLLEMGASVRILDSLLPQSGGSPLNVADVSDRLDIVIEDARSRDVVDRVVDGCDFVFHLAGQSGPKAFGSDIVSEVDIACLGTLNLLEAARVRAQGSRFVFASSFHVYGQPDVVPVSETARTDPDTLFGVHKLTGEKYCGAYAGQVDAISARLGTILGPRMRLQGALAGSVAHVMDLVLHDEDVDLRGLGENVLDVLHVDDAVRALVALATAPKLPGRAVNVGSGIRTTLREIADIAVASCGRGRIRESGTSTSSPTTTFVADVSRLRAIGVKAPIRSVEDTIGASIEWLRGASDS